MPGLSPSTVTVITASHRWGGLESGSRIRDAGTDTERGLDTAQHHAIAANSHHCSGYAVTAIVCVPTHLIGVEEAAQQGGCNQSKSSLVEIGPMVIFVAMANISLTIQDSPRL